MICTVPSTTTPTAPRALLVIEPTASAIASAVASGLETAGVAATVTSVGDGAPLPTEVDLVVVGARASACRAADGDALRSWLTSAWARLDGQLVAAFETGLGRVTSTHHGAAHGASRLLVANGFRLADRPAHFQVVDTAGIPAAAELHRAHAWGSALGRAIRLAPIG